jgi:NAD(P)-dependent dehydrogenase (short-subunit alcohol dehydrogenase family)
MDLKGAAPADYITLAETLQREYGCLHGLVHNAAMLGALTPMSHYDDQLWFEVLQTNLNAPYLLTRNCMELLRCAPDASVLFMADRVGRRGRAYWGAYGVSKAGIENFSRLLAEELEDNTNIRVNTYDPGPVRTALRLIAFPAEDRDALPLPEQVITPCLYLLGAVSRGVSGRQFAFRGS